MMCRDCPACEFNRARQGHECSLTGAQVDISRTISMPDLSSRRGRTITNRGDDGSAMCPGTLDELNHSAPGRKYARSILRQVERRGKLDALLALYPEKQRMQLRALLVFDVEGAVA